MKTTQLAAALVLLTAAFGAAAELEPCEPKNHYILVEPPCPLPSTKTAIGSPYSLVVDPAGNLYFSGSNVVFRLDSSGFVTRVAGNGEAGYSGDGGPASEALLNVPNGTFPYDDYIDWPEVLGGLALDGDGNLYIADTYNHAIRKVRPDGTIVTALAPPPDSKAPSVYGTAFYSDGWDPLGIAVDRSGNIYATDMGGAFIRVAPDGSYESLVAWQYFDFPVGIVLDGEGGVYVAQGCILRVLPDKQVMRVAEPCGNWGFMYLISATALALDDAGNLFIADTWRNCIRKKDTSGQVTVIAGRCSLEQGFWGDGGPATEAMLHWPHGVAVDSAGNVFIADTGNKRIRVITPDGIITTVAGNGL